MAMEFQLWRLVDVKDAQTSTWELVATFANAGQAKRYIHHLAGTNTVSPDEDLYWFEDGDGATHTFRIEAAVVARE